MSVLGHDLAMTWGLDVVFVAVVALLGVFWVVWAVVHAVRDLRHLVIGTQEDQE